MKKLIILFSLLLSVQLLIGQNINVKTIFPEQIEKGKEYTVNITINKSDITTFAQYKQKLPEGFSAKKNDSQTAIFSIKKQVVEFRWDNLPTDSIINISYIIIADTLINNFELQGAFSYVVNNQRGATKSAMQKYKLNDVKNIAIPEGKSVKNTVNDKNTETEENIYDFFNKE